MQLQITKELVEQYHKALPERIRGYLNQRCIPDEIIDRFLIGYNGEAITIPIQNDAGDFIFFKYRSDPDKDKEGKRAYWHDDGAQAQIYGWENLTFSKPYIVICEGELDRLVLEANGIPAITSSAGGGTFKNEWISYLKNIPEVYLCFDNDEPGKKYAEKIVQLIPKSKIIRLPEMGEGKKDITDYFMSGHSKDDFLELISNAISSEEVTLEAELSLLAYQGELQPFHPSQDFIPNKFYYTIPYLEIDKELKSNNVFKQKFIVINSDRRILSLDNPKDFYSKHGLYVKQMPAVKNPDIRWSYRFIKDFKEGYTSNPYEIFTLIKNIVQKYGELKEEGWYDIIPLWCMGSYMFCIFETYPYLGFCGLKGTGKSKMARLLSFMTFNGQHIISIKESTIFRDVESLRSTMCIDESEDLWDPKNNQAVRSLLNAGYCKGGRVPRQEGDTKKGFFTHYYEVYSPKVMSNIKGFEDVLGSRVITVTMLLAKTSKGNTTIRDDSENWPLIRHGQYSFGLCNFKQIRNVYLHDPDVKIDNNRFNDLWAPILSVGKIVFKDNPQQFTKIKEFAREQITKASEENLLDERTLALLKTLKDLVYADGDFPNKAIREGMKVYLSEGEVEEIRSSWIGYRLRNFGLKKKTRQNNGIVYVLRKEDVEDVYSRYIKEEVTTHQNPSNYSHPSHSSLESEDFVNS